MSRILMLIQEFFITLTIGIVFILVFPVFVLVAIIALIASMFTKSDDKSVENYRNFIQENEGALFFCYTNRQNSKSFVEEKILPALEPEVNVIHLEGRIPQSQFSERHISQMLYQIKQLGFPNVMKIKEGRVVDLSLHKELYTTINQGKSSTLFLGVLKERLKELEDYVPVQKEYGILSR